MVHEIDYQSKDREHQVAARDRIDDKKKDYHSRETLHYSRCLIEKGTIRNFHFFNKYGVDLSQRCDIVEKVYWSIYHLSESFLFHYKPNLAIILSTSICVDIFKN